MKHKVIWGGGLAHIGAWTIFPWIRTDKDGWYFSWGVLRLARFVKEDDDID